MNRLKYLFYKFLLGNSVTLLLSLIEGIMGLREEHSALQLLNEGFLIESRYRDGYPFNEGLFKPDQMGEALILPTVQQMRYVAPNQCWKPMNFSKREPSTF
jgi:hypothetical protein